MARASLLPLPCPFHRGLWRLGALLGASLLLSTAACKDDPPAKRQAPPPKVAAKCDGTPKVNDAKNVANLPSKFEGFCLDPSGGDAGYGAGAKKPLDGICNLFDGECEVYKRFGVDRVNEARYVADGSADATIDVYENHFATKRGAFGMYTKRVVGDGDPAHPDTAKPIDIAGAVASMGTGNAYLWKGNTLVEVTYNDASASADAIKAKAEKMLPAFLKAVAAKLAGNTELPGDAAALPTEDRLPQGVVVVSSNALGIKGLGPAAYGYYRKGTQRFRVMVMNLPSPKDAKGAMTKLRAVEGAKVKKDLGDGGVAIMAKDGLGQPVLWTVAQKGPRLYGIADESRVMRSGASAEENAKLTLPEADKLERLKKLMAPAP